MTKFICSAGALALLLGATPALAEPAAPAPTSKTQTDEGDLNKVVCRRVEAIGTRLSAKKVCRTKAQWDSEASANRQDLERSQTQRWQGNT